MDTLQGDGQQENDAPTVQPAGPGANVATNSSSTQPVAMCRESIQFDYLVSGTPKHTKGRGIRVSLALSVNHDARRLMCTMSYDGRVMTS